MVFVIDGRRLDPRARERFVEGWAEMLEQTEPFLYPRAAYAIDYLGQLRELVPLTRDVEVLRTVVDTIRKAPWFDRADVFMAGPERDSARMDTAGTESPDADPESSARADAIAPDYGALSQGIHVFELIGELARGLAPRPGRKSIVWVSTGVNLRVYTAGMSKPSTFSGDPFSFSTFFENDPRTAVAQQALHRVANTANVSIYGLDPSLLSQARRVSVTDTRGPGDKMFLRSASPLSSAGGYDPLEIDLARNDGLRDALRLASRATGGETHAFAGAKVSEAIHEIETAGSTFYLLTYATPPPVGDGRYHRVEVRVTRPGTNVRARHGYVDSPDADSTQYAIASTLALPGLSVDLPFDLAAERMLLPGGRWTLNLRTALYPWRETAAPGGVVSTTASSQHGPWSFHAQAVSGGRIVAEIDRELTVRGDAPVGGSTRTIPLNIPWELAAGDYEIRVGFRDPATGLAGANYLNVTVPEACDGWCAGDVILLYSDGGPLTPAVGSSVPAGHPAAIFVQVHGGGYPVLNGDLFDTTGSQRLAVLRPTPLVRADNGLFSGTLGLPQGLGPGHYLIRARVTDPPAGGHRSYEIVLDVRPAPSARPTSSN